MSSSPVRRASPSPPAPAAGRIERAVEAPAVSFVIPVFNEEESLPLLHAEIRDVARAAGLDYEIVFVDDGSTDGSLDAIRALAQGDRGVRYAKFRGNQGQTAAMDAGFRRARGRVVVTLDADLQNDPKDVPRLLAALDGCDVVCGVRAKRRDTVVRRVSSKIANGIRNWLTDEKITDVGCSLKAYKRECLARLKLYEGMHRFLPTLLKIEGYAVKEIPVNHRPRQKGVSKYGVWNRAWKALRDCLAVRWMKRRALRYVVEDET